MWWEEGVINIPAAPEIQCTFLRATNDTIMACMYQHAIAVFSVHHVVPWGQGAFRKINGFIDQSDDYLYGLRE